MEISKSKSYSAQITIHEVSFEIYIWQIVHERRRSFFSVNRDFMLKRNEMFWNVCSKLFGKKDKHREVAGYYIQNQ